MDLFHILTFDQSLELLEMAALLGKQDSKLLNLPLSNISINQIGRCLMALSKLFSEYKLSNEEFKQLESLVTTLKDKFNTIHVNESMMDGASTYRMVKNLNRTLTSLGSMKRSSESLTPKALEILTNANCTDNNLKLLSIWSETITILMLTQLNGTYTLETIKLDDRFHILDQRLFDIAITLVNSYTKASRYLITVITSSIYSMSIMDSFCRRDLSTLYEFCKRNMNTMDNVHLLMISDAIPKMKDPEANEWRALFTNIRKGIDRITQSDITNSTPDN